MVVHNNRCKNKSWQVDKIEALVWAELERYLSEQNLVKHELEKQYQYANNESVFVNELHHIKRQLKEAEREQRQLLRWALKDFPADQVEIENKRINRNKNILNNQKAELEEKIKLSKKAVIDVPKLETFIKGIQDRITYMDFESKRLALEMLDITIWLDGENAEITGVIDPEYAIVTKQT